MPFCWSKTRAVRVAVERPAQDGADRARVDRVEWEERLFAFLDDLESQAEALYAADRAPDLLDRSRAEYAAVTLAARLMASLGHHLVLDVLGVGTVGGSLRRVGPDWCLVQGTAQDWVLRGAAVISVEGASPRAVPELAWSPVARLGFGSALRRLADAGEPCVVHGTDGTSRPVVLARVGSDFVEVRTGEDRTLLLRHAGIAAVQSRT
jgi:hypothetical protein